MKKVQPDAIFTRDELAEIASNARALLTSIHVGSWRGHDIASCPIEHFLSDAMDTEARREAGLNQVILCKCTGRHEPTPGVVTSELDLARKTIDMLYTRIQPLKLDPQLARICEEYFAAAKAIRKAEARQ